MKTIILDNTKDKFDCPFHSYNDFDQSLCGADWRNVDCKGLVKGCLVFDGGVIVRMRKTTKRGKKDGK